MRKVLLILIICTFGSLAHAGGDWSEAKVTKFSFNEQAQLIFEIEWVKENGFLSKSDYRRFVFEFHNWPTASHRWFHQALPWTPSDAKIYPLKDLAACQNLLIDAFIRDQTLQLGQMGTVPFQLSTSTENAGVVPFAKVVKQEGMDVCLLYAAPI